MYGFGYRQIVSEQYKDNKLREEKREKTRKETKNQKIRLFFVSPRPSFHVNINMLL